MGSWQGSVFGFSNTILGVAAFMIPILLGFALLAGATFSRWFWVSYHVGLLGGVVFVTWLQYQSIYGLGTLCPWCMVVWAAMIPLWWVSVTRAGASGQLTASPWVRRVFAALYSWAWVIVVLHLAIVATIAQLVLDWFMEFRV